jgi:hypothetical protein
MNRSRSVVSMALMLGLASFTAGAVEVIDPKENYAFDVPAGWEDKHAKFGLFVTAEGVGSLSESKLSFVPTSLEQAAAQQASIFGNANATFKRIEEPVALTGKGWAARVTPFRGNVNTILLMVAKDSRKYRVFFLTVRNQAYAQDKEKYWKILRTWRSPA